MAEVLLVSMGSHRDHSMVALIRDQINTTAVDYLFPMTASVKVVAASFSDKETDSRFQCHFSCRYHRGKML